MRRRDLIAGVAATAAMGLRPAGAQQRKMPVVGFLWSTSPAAAAPVIAGFYQGLGEAGYVERQNVTIEYRWAEGHNDRLPALAADLVSRKVDVIVTGGNGPAALAAKGATSTIPIVFSLGVDPVRTGLVASLARPGGNLTGVTGLGGSLVAKRLELLCELVPQARVIGYLVNPDNSFMPSSVERIIGDLPEVARAKGVQLQIVKASPESEIDAAFAALLQLQAGALLVGSDAFLSSRREQIVALASRHAVPTMYEGRLPVDIGGLIGYGQSLGYLRPVGLYVGKILKGAKPADLPVQQPTTFELVINLKTAKALGLTVPQSILARADEVIE
jgi:putative ABC transport system substrate-binding protein